MSVSRLKFVTQIACFATLFEEKGTFYKKRGPKGDPFGPKGPLRDLGPLKGTHLVTLLFSPEVKIINLRT